MAQRPSDVVVGVILVILVLFLVWTAFSFFRPSMDQRFMTGEGDVAVISMSGMITDARPFLERLEHFVDRRDVQAIVIRVESPGGVVAASQEMYEGVKRARDTGKPVVISMGSIAASGAYYLALGADTILANPGTLTGSIGVLMDFPQTTKLLNTLGIEFHSVTSGPLKNAGAPYTEWDEQTREYFSSIVMNTYEQFITAVAEERRMDIDSVRTLADGRVYTGEQALHYGLVDQLGDLHQAIRVAAEMAGIAGEPTIVKSRERQLRLWDVLFGDLNQLMDQVYQAPLLEYRYP